MILCNLLILLQSKAKRVKIASLTFLRILDQKLQPQALIKSSLGKYMFPYFHQNLRFHVLDQKNATFRSFMQSHKNLDYASKYSVQILRNFL